MIAWIAAALAAQVTPYPLPVGDTASSVYTVSVNGASVPVSNSRDASYAPFAFKGLDQARSAGVKSEPRRAEISVGRRQ